MSFPSRPLVPLTLLALAAASGAQDPELHTLRGERVAVYDLAGRVALKPIEGSAVEVEVRRGGSGASELRVESGPLGERETLRVVFPADTILYRQDGQKGQSTSMLNVRADGTFGDDGPRGGRKVTVRNQGEGLEAHADLAIGVPVGQRFELYLGVGHVNVTNLDGHLRIDTAAAPIEAAGLSGEVVLDTGSGGVVLDGGQGTISIDTGSGAVLVRSVEGPRLHVDTGSGAVHVEGAKVDELDVDTGSGEIDVRGVQAGKLKLDTGSGAILARLTAPFEEAILDTGSGSVTVELTPDQGASFELDTGSGRVEVELPHETTRKGRRELVGKVGDGRGRLRVDTGSGNIKLVKST